MYVHVDVITKWVIELVTLFPTFPLTDTYKVFCLMPLRPKLSRSLYLEIGNIWTVVSINSSFIKNTLLQNKISHQKVFSICRGRNSKFSVNNLLINKEYYKLDRISLKSTFTKEYLISICFNFDLLRKESLITLFLMRLNTSAMSHYKFIYIVTFWNSCQIFRSIMLMFDFWFYIQVCT